MNKTICIGLLVAALPITGYSPDARSAAKNNPDELLEITTPEAAIHTPGEADEVTDIQSRELKKQKPEELFMRGMACERGEGVVMDQAEALEWYHMAAERGHVPAQLRLGHMYTDGIGTEKNYPEAVKWWEKAAHRGNAEAQYNMGAMCYLGEGVKKDYKASAKWYRKSADQGYAKAQYNLARMYHDGLGVKQDFDKAVKWWKKAAEQGHPRAQYNLGAMYHNGTGLEKNTAMAKEWFKKSCDNGLQEGCDAYRELVKGGY